MSKTITIPACRNPFRVIIGAVEYSYPAGATVEVPDAVAAVIEHHVALQPKEDPDAANCCPLCGSDPTGTGGGGSASDGSHNAVQYVYDDTDRAWFNYSSYYAYTGYCPNCGCLLSTDSESKVKTLCPCCNASILYDNGNVTFDDGSGDSGDDNTENTGARIYAIVDGFEVNAISGSDILDCSATMDLGNRYYLEADGELIGYGIYNDYNSTRWQVGDVWVDDVDMIHGTSNYGTISIYRIEGEVGSIDHGNGEWTCGYCATGANTIGDACGCCGKPCPF
jgi:nitrite reductase/ring-hydroxylating ferredoxin subunit